MAVGRKTMAFEEDQKESLGRKGLRQYVEVAEAERIRSFEEVTDSFEA